MFKKRTILIINILLLSIFSIFPIGQVEAAPIVVNTNSVVLGPHSLVRSISGTLYAVYVKPLAGFDQIYVSCSVDDGVTWPVATRISTYAGMAGYDERYPSIAIDSSNFLHVVWNGKATGFTINDQVWYSTFTGSWSSPLRISTYTGMDGYYQGAAVLAVDGNNALHVVWNGKATGFTAKYQIWYTKYSGSWASPLRISTYTGMDGYDQSMPRLSLDANNYIHVVWEGKATGFTTNEQIWYTKYSGSWATPTRLSTLAGMATAYHTGAAIAVDVSGVVHVVWSGAFSGIYTIYYTKYTYIWSNPVIISTYTGMDANNQRYPSIAIDSHGFIHVVWSGKATGYTDYEKVWYTRYETSWASPLVLQATGRNIMPDLRWSFHYSNSGTVDYLFTEGTGAPFDVMRDIISGYNLPSDISTPTITITALDADNWVFAETKYYTFNMTFKHTSNWTLIDTMRIDFMDGSDWIKIQYRISTERYMVTSGDDKVVIRIISAGNTSITDYRLVFGVYFTKNIIDAYDVDIWAWANSTIGGEYYDLIEPDYFNIYNLGGRTQYKTIGDPALSSHPTRGDPFNLIVTGSGNGDIEVNVTYRNLQEISLLTKLIIPSNYITSGYSTDWIADYGFYYYANGSWTLGWTAQLNIEDGSVATKNFWVKIRCDWFRGDGGLVGTDYFSSFYKPGTVSGTSVWVDLWFSNTNSSTVGAGRVSAEYYGMQDAAPWWGFWYSDWGPLLSNQTMSYYEMALLDSTGAVINTKDIELVKVYSRLHKNSDSSYSVETKAPEVFDRKIARGDFTGIPTPPFVPPKVMDMPQGGMFGLLQTFLFSIVAAITQALMPSFSLAAGVLDALFAWAGWPGGFTQLSGWIITLAGFMVSAMGWAITLLTSLFSFFTITVPAFLYIVTEALGTYVNMITMFWGYFTGLFGTGFDLWNDFGGSQWVTIGIIIYPLYLLLLWTEHGLTPVMAHLEFWGGLIMGLINLAISLAGLVWSFISGLIENIPVVE